MCVFLIVICPFVLFHLVIVLSGLRFTDSDYPFDIFKFFLKKCFFGWKPSCTLMIIGCFHTMLTFFMDRKSKFIISTRQRLTQDSIGNCLTNSFLNHWTNLKETLCLNIYLVLCKMCVYVDRKSKIAATTKLSLTWNVIGKEI